MFDQLSTLFAAFDEHELTPVTVRCRVAGEPQLGSEGGRKTLYRITDPVGEVPPNTFVSFWHTTPFDGSFFPQTDRDILSLVMPEREGTPLEVGEEILVRGVPKYSEAQDKYFINVTSLLIRRPDLQIGKGQLRLPNECERLLHLLFEKNVYRPRDSFEGNAKTSGSFRGQIAHKAFEYALTRQPYLDYFEQDLWDGDAVDSLVEEVLSEEFLIEQALHSLRGTGKNEAVETAAAAVEELLTNGRLTNIVTDAETVRSEAGLSHSYGFAGQVDLIVDGVPFDLKTGSRKRADEFQIKLYLFALLLERLDRGDDINDELDDGIDGFLIYADGDGDGVDIERVELTKSDLTNIMELRNVVVSARSRFGVPSPYGEDCEGCILRYGDNHGGLDDEYDPMPSACKFHCQSERRWPCYEVDADYEFETKCPLFDDCDERFEFRNPDITDHYNELRAALHSERETRRNTADFLAQLSDETLIQAGLLLPDLSIDTFLSDRRIAYESPTAVSGMSIGDAVEITQANQSHGWTATYLGQRDGRFIFEFDSRPTHRVTVPDITYEARRAPQATALPKKYLRQLDFAQRTGIDPRLRTSDADATYEGESAPVSEVEGIDVEHLLSVPEAYIDIPVREDRTRVLEQLVHTIANATHPLLDDEGTVSYGDKRTLVLCSRPLTVDRLHEALKETGEYVRFDGSDADEPSLPGDRTQHEIKEDLKSSRLILSSTQYAVTEEVFHYMASGDPDHRTHSSKFFDTVVMLGADRIAEPAFHFLSKLADRTVAVADVRRRDIELLSQKAATADLTEPYFKRAFDRYVAVDTDDVETVRLAGNASEPAVGVLGDNRLESLDKGTVDFVACDGSEQLATETMTVETSIQCAGDPARQITFELVNPSSTAADIGPIFEDREQLDATSFEPGEEYILSETTLRCIEKSDVDNDEAVLHRVTIELSVSSTPFLTTRLLSNPAEASKAANVAIEGDADVVFTPFTAQASLIRDGLDELGSDIPVQITSEWAGTIEKTAVISPTVANKKQLIHPPLNQFETLYTLLSAGIDMTIVGNRETLRSNDIIRDLV